ncbi:MAG: hypothetical protein OXE86_10720 [Alphaproteobacteria bacterium]|nr:hypothetical protein [Alphaproteobacteria bacterium]
MATDSEWARIRECAAAEGMDISRFVVQRATTPDAVPMAVVRRALREVLVLTRLERERIEELGLGEQWAATGAAVDAWMSREADLERLTDFAAAERWQAVSGSADPGGGPVAAS